jgi:hypothetical protein
MEKYDYNKIMCLLTYIFQDNELINIELLFNDVHIDLIYFINFILNYNIIKCEKGGMQQLLFYSEHNGELPALPGKPPTGEFIKLSHVNNNINTSLYYIINYIYRLSLHKKHDIFIGEIIERIYVLFK